MRAGPSIVTLLLAGVLVLPAPVLAQQTYPLRCNLPGTGLTLWADGFSMTYRGARASYQDRAPAPGECAWSDRGFRSGEPLRLQWRDEGRMIFGTLELDQDGRVTGPIYAAGGGDDALDLFNLVMDQWYRKGAVTFWVYRDGDVMQVRRVRRVR